MNKTLAAGLATTLALIALLLTPGLALANNVTGIVESVRTCPDGSGGQKVVIHVRNSADNTLKRIYLGIETGGSSTFSSVALGAMLSGKTITIEYSSNAATQCGVTALYGNATSHWIQIEK